MNSTLPLNLEFKFIRPLASLMGKVRSVVGRGFSTPRRVPAVHRANRAAAADLDWFHGIAGGNSGWAKTEYGEYFASAVSVYAAVKLRAEALSRVAVVVHRQFPDGTKQPVGPFHPAQQLLDRVNGWYTRGDLWRATEIYLSLWGSAY